MGNVRKKEGSTGLVELAPEEIRQLPRPHKGFEQFVEPFVALYKENESALRVEGIDLVAMVKAVRAYQALAAEEEAAAKQLQLIQSTRLMYGAQAWGPLLEIYARAQSAARTNPAIRHAIAAFAHLMKKGPRKKAAAAIK